MKTILLPQSTRLTLVWAEGREGKEAGLAVIQALKVNPALEVHKKPRNSKSFLKPF